MRDKKIPRKRDHPLSREGWVMLLSGEINKEEMKLSTYWNACIVILIAFLGGVGMVAALVARFQKGVSWVICTILVVVTVIFLALAVIVWLLYKYYRYPKFQERLKPLIKAREATISSKSTDFSEIRGIWGKYVEKWLLEKIEIDDKNEMKRTHYVNFCYALCGSCISIGGVAASIGYFSSGVSIFNKFILYYGLLMIMVGLVIMLYALYWAVKEHRVVFYILFSTIIPFIIILILLLIGLF